MAKLYPTMTLTTTAEFLLGDNSAGNDLRNLPNQLLKRLVEASTMGLLQSRRPGLLLVLLSVQQSDQ
jgi:hypothetical protein